MQVDQMRGLLKAFEKQTTAQDTRVSQNVDLLKSITEYPEDVSPPNWNHYIEPILVEFFVPKVGRFIKLTKYLFIELYDPRSEKEEHIQVHEYFKEKNTPIDIVELMDTFPQYMMTILDYCGERMDFYEKIGAETLEGLEGNVESMIRALHLTEVIKKKEPTLATFEILGDYIRYNLNWYIRYLNQRDIEFSLEDETIYYLMNIYLAEKEERGETIPERFYQLREIYLEQAFPLMDDDEDRSAF